MTALDQAQPTVCWFCRNSSHENCSGYYDMVGVRRCKCSERAHR